MCKICTFLIRTSRSPSTTSTSSSRLDTASSRLRERAFGNKRIGSFLFMLYLQQEQITHHLNLQALTALALLIAESAPANKDLMVRLILNLLASDDAVQ